jgi:hypothetical protein
VVARYRQLHSVVSSDYLISPATLLRVVKAHRHWTTTPPRLFPIVRYPERLHVAAKRVTTRQTPSNSTSATSTKALYSEGTANSFDITELTCTRPFRRILAGVYQGVWRTTGIKPKQRSEEEGQTLTKNEGMTPMPPASNQTIHKSDIWRRLKMTGA